MTELIKPADLIGLHFDATSDLSNKDTLLLKVIRCGCTYCEKGFHIYRNKEYAYFTVHIVFDGCGFLHIGQKDYLLQKGDAFIITAGEEHLYKNDTCSNLGLLWIEFCGNGCKELLSCFPLNNIHVLSNVHNSNIEQQLMEILQYLHKTPNYNEYRLSSMTYTFLMYLIEAENSVAKSQSPAMIVSALNYINQNFTTQMKVSSLAESLHVSHTYLTKLFHKHVGTSPAKYINLKRIEYACYLLQNTNLSCEEISERIGMYDNAYFYKMFKASTGTTPNQYKQTSFLNGGVSR